MTARLLGFLTLLLCLSACSTNRLPWRTSDQPSELDGYWIGVISETYRRPVTVRASSRMRWSASCVYMGERLSLFVEEGFVEVSWSGKHSRSVIDDQGRFESLVWTSQNHSRQLTGPVYFVLRGELSSSTGTFSAEYSALDNRGCSSKVRFKKDTATWR